MEDKRRTFSGRLVRWAVELVLVFIGVYAAFWLNNYQLHRQEAKRCDQILASIERTLHDGIKSGKINAAEQEQEAAEFQRALDAAEMPPLHPFVFTTDYIRAILARCFKPAGLSCSTWKPSPRCATTNRLSAGD
jgi:hypothetical protein